MATTRTVTVTGMGGAITATEGTRGGTGDARIIGVTHRIRARRGGLQIGTGRAGNLSRPLANYFDAREADRQAGSLARTMKRFDQETPQPFSVPPVYLFLGGCSKRSS